MGRGVAVLRFAGSQYRNKGLTERAFSKQAAKQVGNAECHVEGVGHGARAENRRNEQLAHQAGNA